MSKKGRKRSGGHGAPASRSQAASVVRTASNPQLRLGALLALIALGVIVRIVAVAFSPQNGYVPDHVSHMGRFQYAWNHGPWSVYEMERGEPFLVRMTNPQTGLPGVTIRPNPHHVNYPPLAAYLFWVSGATWRVLDSDVETVQLSPPVARQLGLSQPQLSSVLVDTFASRFADGLTPMLFDFLLAWGVMTLVRQLGGGAWLGVAAFGVVMLAPPIWLDSAFWIQFESWVSSMLVWTMVLLLRRQWLLAGLLYGAALMTKAQAILFGPTLVFIGLALLLGTRGDWRTRWLNALHLLKTAGAAAVMVLFIAAPFMINDATDPNNTEGVFRWYQRAYVGTITDERYERITHNAFNLWCLNALAYGPPEPGEDFFNGTLSNEVRWFGLTKQFLGKALLSMAIIAAWGLVGWRYGWSDRSWVVTAFLVMFAAFTLPTTVHERYIYFGMPFVFALMFIERRWLLPAAVLMLVGTFEMTSFRWMSYTDAAVRIGAFVLSSLIVLAFVYCYAVVALRKPRLSAAAPPRSG